MPNKREMRDMLNDILEECPVIGKFYGLEMETERIADHLIANGVTVQKWIPVTERLPEKSGGVLGYHTRWGVSRYYYHYSLRNADWRHITHWMPLPEPPKEE